MVTLKELQQETDRYRNTLVIDFFDIKLFLGVIDGGDDYYYQYIGWRDNKVILSSCVGWFIPLVDRLDKDQYNYLANCWNLNNDTKAE